MDRGRSDRGRVPPSLALALDIPRHGGTLWPMRALSEKVVTVVEPELKDWIRDRAERMDRSEGSIVRLALRDYRAKVTRRKDA